jgi:hypothetical protein
VSVLIFLGQALLGVPFVVFAYWYERQEVLYRDDRAPWNHTMFGHAVFGLFFSVSFAILGLSFLPTITGIITLVAGIYIYLYARLTTWNTRKSRTNYQRYDSFSLLPAQVSNKRVQNCELPGKMLPISEPGHGHAVSSIVDGKSIAKLDLIPGIKFFA